MNLINFKYGRYDILCPKSYYQFLNEAFVLDVYRASLLRRGDVVLDLGAGTGDFCIIASKRVGNSGKVVALEPNAEDFRILETNIHRNGCKNITPINLGVGSRAEVKEMTFWGKTFSCKIETLENIFDELSMTHAVDFVKMDIEGAEIEVLGRSIGLIGQARVVSLEFHPLYGSTKQKIDSFLLPQGFTFIPITMSYVYKRMLTNLILHPFALYKSAIRFIKVNRQDSQKIVTGFDWLTGAGTYLKK
jgi:FkbM family methyltransferase